MPSHGVLWFTWIWGWVRAIVQLTHALIVVSSNIDQILEKGA